MKPSEEPMETQSKTIKTVSNLFATHVSTMIKGLTLYDQVFNSKDRIRIQTLTDQSWGMKRPA